MFIWVRKPEDCRGLLRFHTHTHTHTHAQSRPLKSNLPVHALCPFPETAKSFPQPDSAPIPQLSQGRFTAEFWVMCDIVVELERRGDDGSPFESVLNSTRISHIACELLDLNLFLASHEASRHYLRIF